ncbi:endothelin-converting enzyme homolog isoform X2 [Hetaerina americana]|uniref:endothelin-converting enzyme homolog isoform X2 n=1 Tax=Hetaerina americana TaxID=62018 RepID=UPI003A7F6260
MADNPGVNCSTWTIPMSQASDSHPDLVEVSSRSAYLKRAASQSPKPNVQRRLLGAIIFLAFLTAALILAIGILSYHFSKTSNAVLQQARVCTSNQCVETAANLIESLDLEIDPCEDFYKFTCGKWAGSHPIPDFASSTDWFYERKSHLAQRIRKVLEKNTNDSQPIPVTQAQMLYHSCLNTTGIDNAGIEPMLQILDHAGLPRKLQVNATPAFNSSYSYPIMKEGILSHAKPKQSNLSAELRWLVPLVGCKRVLGKDPLIGFAVLPHPLNRTVNVLTVAAPSMISPLPENELSSGNTGGGHIRSHWQERRSWTKRQSERRQWEHLRWKWRKSEEGDDPQVKEDEMAITRTMYMESLVKFLDLWEALKSFTIDPTLVVDYVTNYKSGVSSSGGNKDDLKNYIHQIDSLQDTVYKLVLESIEEEINMTYEFSSGKDRPPPFDEMHVSDLQRLTDEAAYDENSNPNQQIDWQIFFNLMFEGSNITLDFKKDLIIVQNMNYLKGIAKILAKTSPLVLGLLWWEVVFVVAPHGNNLMRHLYNSYVEKITGGEIPRSRAMDCARITNDMMGMAVSWLLASEELAINITSPLNSEDFTNVVEDKRKKVEKMLTDIRDAFSELVLNLDWMDQETKDATLNKSEAMRSYIGYPSWLMTPKELETYYEGLTINISTYLQNLVNVVQVGELWAMDSLRIENNIEAWATDPTDVNAFHTFQENAVTIPAGILQFPFYGLGLEALNYGAIGSVLGHELTHGFDNSGRQFDQNGNWRQWWSNKTIAEYINRTACFVDQYSSYLIPEVNVTVNGKQTLGENIADNGGIHEAWAAYNRYKQRTNEITDSRLPGLEQFSQDHLLFIAFGSLWCEHGTAATAKWILERDEHSPSKARVWGAISNSKEFAKTFNCPVGSPMNPDVKCRLW